MSTSASTSPPPPTFLTSLISGGLSGLSVDLLLYPIDTIKTRLQSPSGFHAAGGIKGVYKGIGSVAVGSAPGAGVFFCVYDSLKNAIGGNDAGGGNASVHMASAMGGEVTACGVRVPTEVVKSKMQTGAMGSNTLKETVKTVIEESGVQGLYRGFGITVMREIPFALIQFPIYERLKVELTGWKGGLEPTPVQAAGCGSAGGAVAALLTTPLDVVKTRVMLGDGKKGVGGDRKSVV